MGYSQVKYPIVDLGQKNCYSDNGKVEEPKLRDVFYGQDVCIQGNQLKYKDNGVDFFNLNVVALKILRDIMSKLEYVLVTVSDKNLSIKWVGIFDKDVKKTDVSKENCHKWNLKVDDIFIIHEEL